MKKLISLLLAALLCLGACACAEGAIKSLPEQILEDAGDGEAARLFDPDEVEAPERAGIGDVEEKKAIGEAPAAEDKAITSDIVFVNNNDYTVLLPIGLTFHYRAPSDVYVFTQDLAQQSALYAACYSSPREVVDHFIDSGMHCDIYDDASGVDIFLHVYNTSLAALYGNSGSLTGEEADYLASYMLTSGDYMLNCSEIVYGWDGGNMWFVGDRCAYDGTVVLCTFVGGYEVFGVVKAGGVAEYNRIIDLLDYLTISY